MGGEGEDVDKLEADVSANKGGGLHHCLLLRYLAHEHQGLEESILLLKLWLKRRALPGIMCPLPRIGPAQIILTSQICLLPGPQPYTLNLKP